MGDMLVLGGYQVIIMMVVMMIMRIFIMKLVIVNIIILIANMTYQDVGYDTIIIDDCWLDLHRTADGALQVVIFIPFITVTVSIQ